MDSTNCPSLETLFQWSVCALTEAEAARTVEHVETCARCEQALTEIESGGLFADTPTTSSEPEDTADNDDLLDGFWQEKECRQFISELQKLAPSHKDLEPAIEQYGTRFTRIRSHAKGGIGYVSVAQDLELTRQVALKEILPQFADDPSARARFLREAEITGQLEHPGIVPIYSVGQHPNGRPYYAMRFIEGVRLSDAIKRYHANAKESSYADTRRELQTLLGRFIAVCDSANFAHQQNIIHRDIKPDNIMLGEHGETLLVDWGLAKRLDETNMTNCDSESVSSESSSSETRPTLESPAATSSGLAVGTMAYMSPEQAAGAELSTRSDVFSLSATLFELLTGRRPYQATGYDGLQQALNADFKDPLSVNSSVPRTLAAICRRGMSADPDERYPTARAIANDIEHWMADLPVEAYSENLSERAFRFARRHSTAVRIASIALVCITLLSILSALMINSALVDRVQALEQTERQLQISRVREYANHLAVASLALETNDYALAQESLDSCNASVLSWEHQHMQALLDSRTKILSAHTDTVDSVAIAEGGRIACSHSFDGTLRVWDLGCGIVKNVVQIHDRSIRKRCTLALTRDAQQAVVLFEGKLALWNLESGDKVKEVSASKSFVAMNVVKADNTFAVATNSSLDFFDQALNKVSTHPARLTQLLRFDLSSDGRQLVTAHDDGTVKIWQIDGTERASFQHGHGNLSCVSIDPTGKWILTCGQDVKIRVWESSTGNLVHTLSGHTVSIFDAEFSPDGKQIASASGGNNLRVWATESGNELQILKGHKGQVLDVAFFDDGTQILSGSQDNTLRIWNLGQRPPVRELRPNQGTISSVSFTPEAKRLVIGGHNGEIRLLDAANGNTVRTFGKHQDKVVDVAVSPDGRLVASASRDHHARVWEVESGQQVCDCEHATQVFTVRFSADGKSIYTGGSSKRVDVWEVATGVRNRELTQHDDPVLSLASSNDGRFLASGEANDGGVRIWDARQLRLLHALNDEETTGIRALEFNAESTILIAGTGDGYLIAWHVASGQELARIKGHSAAVDSIAFTPDSRRIVTGSWDHSIRFWDANTYQPVFVLRRHEGRIRAVDLSSDGETLLSAGADRRILLWRIRHSNTGSNEQDVQVGDTEFEFEATSKTVTD
ncbi:MAG: protein kinase [Planctomycetota bacterium]